MNSLAILPTPSTASRSINSTIVQKKLGSEGSVKMEPYGFLHHLKTVHPIFPRSDLRIRNEEGHHRRREALFPQFLPQTEDVERTEQKSARGPAILLRAKHSAHTIQVRCQSKAYVYHVP